MDEVIYSVASYVKQTLLNIKKDTDIKDETRFYKITKENGLCALVFSSMNKAFIPQKLYNQLEMDVYSYVSLDTKQLIVIQKVKDILNEAHIKFILLKGSVLKPLYKESYMRVMGDIDLLIEEEALHKVHTLFEQNKITSIGNSHAHDRFMTVDEVYIEVHPRLYHDFDPASKDVFINPWKYAKPLESYQYQLSKEFELVYLLYHLAKHLSASGIGIRSILDIGLYQLRYELEMDKNILETYLINAKLKTFHCVLLELNKKLFDFEFKREFIHYNQLKEEDASMLVTYIITSGLHGNGSNFNAFTARSAHYQLKHKSRGLMIMDIMFPKYTHMVDMYPYVRKIKILIIYAWMSRWFHLLFKKRRSTIRKLRKLKSSHNNVNHTKHIMKTFGL